MPATMVGQTKKCFNSNRLKRPTMLIEVGIVNSQHKYLFIKKLFNPQSLRTFQLTGGLEFMCNFKSLNDESYCFS